MNEQLLVNKIVRGILKDAGIKYRIYYDTRTQHPPKGIDGTEQWRPSRSRTLRIYGSSLDILMYPLISDALARKHITKMAHVWTERGDFHFSIVYRPVTILKDGTERLWR